MDRASRVRASFADRLPAPAWWPHALTQLEMRRSPLLLLAGVVLVSVSPWARAQVPVDLASAATYAVLGSSTVTNTGPTVIDGDLGVSPGTAYTRFPPGTVINGTIHASDAASSQAMTDAAAVYNRLASETFTQDLSGQDLGSRTLTPGVYFFSTTAQLTGILTLDAGNDPNARFDFRIGSTLGSSVGSQVVLIDGAQAANVYWQVGTSMTLLSSSLLKGTVLASSSIVMGTGATVDGRLIALNGAITLDSNDVTVPPAIPEPAAYAALLAATALALAIRRRR